MDEKQNGLTKPMCPVCNRPMSEALSCIDPLVMISGMEVERIPWGDEEGVTAKGRCSDCGIAIGGLHHDGCDQERCPGCDGQRGSCDCEGGFDAD